MKKIKKIPCTPTHTLIEVSARSFGWWLVVGAGLFREKTIAGSLLVADLFYEKSIIGYWLISQTNRPIIKNVPLSYNFRSILIYLCT
jgi:hypothetical protein